jgi:hypothetical protein
MIRRDEAEWLCEIATWLDYLTKETAEELEAIQMEELGYECNYKAMFLFYVEIYREAVKSSPSDILWWVSDIIFNHWELIRIFLIFINNLKNGIDPDTIHPIIQEINWEDVDTSIVKE